MLCGAAVPAHGVPGVAVFLSETLLTAVVMACFCCVTLFRAVVISANLKPIAWWMLAGSTADGACRMLVVMEPQQRWPSLCSTHTTLLRFVQQQSSA
jgi:hypothetical protein